MRFPSYGKARALGPIRANQRRLRACLMPLSSVTTNMTSFLKGIAPEPQINWQQSSSPFGSPRASGWTERPDRSSPSSLDGQDVRVLSPEFHRSARRTQVAMAQRTGSHGVRRRRTKVFLRETRCLHRPGPVYIFFRSTIGRALRLTSYIACITPEFSALPCNAFVFSRRSSIVEYSSTSMIKVIEQLYQLR